MFPTAPGRGGWRRCSAVGADSGTVLVTGGASGLGAAVVAAVLAAGGRPLGPHLHPPRDGAEHAAVDLSDPRAAEQAVRSLAESSGGLDAVVTAAGTDACGRLDEI